MIRIRTIPLVEASLKGFARNWKSILLLVISPLLFISVIFLSFNPEGLRKIPVGVISNSPAVDMDEFTQITNSFLTISNYGNLDDCVVRLKQYYPYACIDIHGMDPVVVDVYYDNTRDPVIWEVVQNIKRSVDYLQEQKSKEMASDFLNQFSSRKNLVSSFRSNLQETNSNVDTYIYKIDESIVDLREAKTDLSQTIVQMDRDIEEVETEKNRLEHDKNAFYYETTSTLNTLDSAVDSMKMIEDPYYNSMVYMIEQDIAEMRNEVEDYNDEVDDYFDTVELRVAGYKESSNKGKGYVNDIDDNVEELEGTKQDLEDYKEEIDDADAELAQVEEELSEIDKVNPEELINPIVVYNNPVYEPTIAGSKVSDVVKMANLVSLQIMFPKVLLLIVMFLALLISSYLTLQEINSTSNIRINMIEGMFFPEFFSVYISSIIIVIFPILIVLGLGQVLFKLAIIQNFHVILPILLLMVSVFIMMGISIAFLVRKKSITLLVNSFILVFLIFFSGFLQPIEKMRAIFGFFSFISAGNVALSAFNKILFYSQGFVSVLPEIIILGIILFLVMISALLFKKMRDYPFVD